MNGLRIGDVARRSGVNLETIRFYERKGLLPMPPRAPSGYRAFSTETVDRVRMIKRTQALGFSLREIKELLSLGAEPGSTCADVRRRAEAKLADIDREIVDLQRIKAALAELAGRCSGRGSIDTCPILQSEDREHTESSPEPVPTPATSGRKTAARSAKAKEVTPTMISTLPVLMALSWVPLVNDVGWAAGVAAAPGPHESRRSPDAAADTVRCPLTGDLIPSCRCPVIQSQT